MEASPSSKKWLSFFGKRKKSTSSSIDNLGRRRNDGEGVARNPYIAREMAKANPSRNRNAVAFPVPGEETTTTITATTTTEESVEEEGRGLSRMLPTERPQPKEQESPKLVAGETGGKAAAAAAEGGSQKSQLPAPKSTLPTYEEARRRSDAQQQERERPGRQQQVEGGERVTTGTTAAGFASPPASCACIRSGDAGFMQGRRRDSSGVSLRRGGGARTITTGLEPGARVLCLDIFVSAIGGDEIRQWRLGEVRYVRAFVHE